MFSSLLCDFYDCHGKHHVTSYHFCTLSPLYLMLFWYHSNNFLISSLYYLLVLVRLQPSSWLYHASWSVDCLKQPSAEGTCENRLVQSLKIVDGQKPCIAIVPENPLFLAPCGWAFSLQNTTFCSINQDVSVFFALHLLQTVPSKLYNTCLARWRSPLTDSQLAELARQKWTCTKSVKKLFCIKNACWLYRKVILCVNACFSTF